MQIDPKTCGKSIFGQNHLALARFYGSVLQDINGDQTCEIMVPYGNLT